MEFAALGYLLANLLALFLSFLAAWQSSSNQGLAVLFGNGESVSNIVFITVHGLNEGHIAPYTDIEFRLTKYQTYIIMKFWYKSLQLIIEETITLLTKIKHIKQMALKYFTTG